MFRAKLKKDSDRTAIMVCNLLGVAIAVLPLLTPAGCTDGDATGVRVRRSDDYDNSDNLLMRADSDYDYFFLKAAKSVPRIGRRSDLAESEQALHVDRRSADMNALVPNGAYDHFFLKASKSVPRIGKRNDDFFMKTAKSVPRIGRRSGNEPENFHLKGLWRDNYLKTSDTRVRRIPKNLHVGHQSASGAVVEENDIPLPSLPGGEDAYFGGPVGHNIHRRNYDGFMSKAAKSVPRMGKRLLSQTDIGDLTTFSQWPWFRQQDGPVPYKRANRADFINFAELPWGAIDAFLRARETHDVLAENEPDVFLLDNTASNWKYHVGNDGENKVNKDKGIHSKSSDSSKQNKELDETRLQPDV